MQSSLQANSQVNLPVNLAVNVPNPISSYLPRNLPNSLQSNLERLDSLISIDALNCMWQDAISGEQKAYFVFQVEGYAMKQIGIFDGDKVLVDSAGRAVSGDVVVAVLDGNFILRRLVKQAGRIELEAENPEFETIRVNAGNHLEILGVLVGVVGRYH